MEKIGFEYKYQNVYEIIKTLKLDTAEFLYIPIFIAIFVSTYFLIYRIGPMFHIYKNYKKDQKVKLKKKQFIERIKLQNEIEDEVEKDLK